MWCYPNPGSPLPSTQLPCPTLPLIIRAPHIVAIDIAIRQHHGWVVLIHHVTRDLADQAGVGTVSHGQGLRQFVQRAAAHRTVGALGAAILLVALSVHMVKERLYLYPQGRHAATTTGYTQGILIVIRMQKTKKAQGEKNAIIHNNNGYQHLT